MMEWIDANDRMPEILDGKDYSDNVLAVINGELGVACLYLHIDADEPEASGYIWCNCYGVLDGDAEMDDEYTVTHWMPMPKLPMPLG